MPGLYIPKIDQLPCGVGEQPSHHFAFSKAMQNHIIYDGVFSRCSPRSLLRFSLASRSMHAAVVDYMGRAFDINRTLLPFFSDPRAFRSLQARTGTLISGSFALYFFERSDLRPLALDLIVHSRHRREVGRWLLKAGFEFCPAPHQNRDFEITIFSTVDLPEGGLNCLDGIASILTFVKAPSTDESRPVGMTVKIIVAQSTPMEIVLSSHSTCVMNIITFAAAYCLFPIATLEKHVSLLSSSTKGLYRNRGEALAKYSDRGYSILLGVPPRNRYQDTTQSLFPTGWRWLDDNSTWVIPLDIDGVQAAESLNNLSVPISYDPVSVTNWYTRWNQNKGIVMCFSTLKSELLGYQYAIGDEDLMGHLTDFLEHRGRVEMERLGANAQIWPLCDNELHEVCAKFVRYAAARRSACVRR